MNLVWMCRQAELIEFMLPSLDDVGREDSNEVALIYYTGSRPLLIDRDLPPNLTIYQGRPDLPRLIDAMTASTSTDAKPQQIHFKLNDANFKLKRIARTPKSERAKVLLARALETYTEEQLFQFAVDSSSHLTCGILGLGSSRKSVDYIGIKSLLTQLTKESYQYISAQVSEGFDRHAMGNRMSRNEFNLFISDLVSSESGNDIEMAAPRRFSPRRSGAMKWIRESQARSDLFNSNDEAPTLLPGEKAGTASEVWGMFYCGGSKAVSREIKEIGERTGIPVVFEKFDW